MQGLLDIWNNYWDTPQHSGASTTFDDEWRKKKLLRHQIKRDRVEAFNLAGVSTERKE